MPAPFRGIYSGRRVFITGHSGFKGSWLALWLTRLGANVTGYSLEPPSTPSHLALLSIPITSIRGDVTDLKSLRAAIEQHRPDLIVHMAAQAIVRRSYRDPVETFATNLMGTVNVLESCRRLGTVRAIINVTSDKCYRNLETGRRFREDDPMGGDDPYSASKGGAELIGQAYRHSFFDPLDYGTRHHTLLADVRAGNVIGGGDWAEDRLIPDIMRAASTNQSVTIRNPHATRPWQHVLEPLSAYLHLGWRLLEGRKEFADNWNFGPSDEAALTVQELVERAQRDWNKIRIITNKSSENVREAIRLNIDSTKARKQLHWQNVWNGTTAITRTVHWYKEYYQQGTVRSSQDIDDYEAEALHAGLEWATE